MELNLVVEMKCFFSRKQMIFTHNNFKRPQSRRDLAI